MSKRKDGLPNNGADWIYAKFNSYELAKKKERTREHKLMKREFVNAFMKDQANNEYRIN